ncbi:MAG: TonB-dependent receptor, partial [Bacteroidota bacterium]
GVQSAGEGNSGYYVRGGGIDQNLILLDGNLVFNPVHALGFFSLFHPDMVSGVTLYKGGVPAKYGGRLSSVLDVRLREGNDQRLSAKGGLGIASSRLAVEGPIVKNKASFIFGARMSYFDWILQQTDNVDLRKSQAFFYDLTAKADARLTKTTKLGFTAFSTHDDFQFADEVKFDYETASASAHLKQLIGEKISLNASANVGQYTSALFDVNGNDQSKFTNQIKYLRGNLSGFFQPMPAWELELGAEQTRYRVSPGKLEPLENSIIKAGLLPDEQGDETSFFFHNQLTVSKKIEIVAGIRYTFFKNLGTSRVFLYEAGSPKNEDTISDTLQFSGGEKVAGYSGWEPRLSLRFSLDESSSV